ncbi:MAG: hypothetical protein P4M08_15895 [Oligoflexia bacterium]|nr:hypothetical protein [Oligoflexia bacterium]
MTLLIGAKGGAGGETVDDSTLEEINVERMLVGFLRALISEQFGEQSGRYESEIGGHA